MEAAKKNYKMEKQAQDQQEQTRRIEEVLKLSMTKVPATVSSKIAHFATTVSSSMWDMQSVASFVSFQRDEPHDTPRAGTEIAPPGSCEMQKKQQKS